MNNLGKNSAARMMEGVHPLLIACVCLAMRKYCSIDFGVGEFPVRDIKMQRGFVASRKSKTMDSKHLPQDDGYSHAVDLYPVGYNPSNAKSTKMQAEAISYAMEKAAFDLGLELDGGFNWGWDLFHFEIKNIYSSMVELVKVNAQYRNRKNTI